MTEKAKKRPAKKSAGRVRKLGIPRVEKGPKLPTGVGDDMIPLSMLLRFNTFVETYMQDLDGPAAAKAAGWECNGNVKAQAAHAKHLLANPYIRTRIEQQYRAIIAKTGATVERVWEEISHIAFLDPIEIFNDDGTPRPLEEMAEGARRAITGRKRKVVTGEEFETVEEEVKFAGKDAAIEKLMRLHRMTDNDKMVLIDGEEFLRAMEEGRQRAAGAQEGRQRVAGSGK